MAIMGLAAAQRDEDTSRVTPDERVFACSPQGEAGF